MVISSYIPFPNINWWQLADEAGKVCFDAAEHFEKMTYRNKYFIAGANGGIQLSIPLMKGREQRTPMHLVMIDNRQRWQVQHWRTIVSVYKRSPYFEHYEPSLQPLFDNPYEQLAGFNAATTDWLKKQLKCSFEETAADSYCKTYAETDIDLRKGFKPGIEQQPIAGNEPYYQMFSNRNGFLKGLSGLDLLFSEGPYALKWIQMHKEMIKSWRR